MGNNDYTVGNVKMITYGTGTKSQSVFRKKQELFQKKEQNASEQDKSNHKNLSDRQPQITL